VGGSTRSSGLAFWAFLWPSPLSFDHQSGLLENSGIIGRRAPVPRCETGRSAPRFHPVGKVVDCELEGAQLGLLLEEDGKEAASLGAVGLESRHQNPSRYILGQLYQLVSTSGKTGGLRSSCWRRGDRHCGHGQLAPRSQGQRAQALPPAGPDDRRPLVRATGVLPPPDLHWSPGGAWFNLQCGSASSRARTRSVGPSERVWPRVPFPHAWGETGKPAQWLFRTRLKSG
jgi:hypothetical protein